MATKIFMEALSPTMEEGRLVKWLQNEGDQVASGDTLAEVETDKAIMELVARGDGVLRKRLIGEGDTAPVGTVIGVIAAADEDIAGILAEAGGGAGGGAGGEDTAAPANETAKMTESSPTGAGAPPQQQGTPPATDGQDQSAAATIAHTRQEAAATSVPRTPAQSQGEASAPPEQKVADIPPGGPRPHDAVPGDGAQQASGAGQGERPRSSPLARRLASERGLDLGSIRGSGPAGRIIRRDVESAITAAPAAAAAPSAGAAVQPPAPAREGDYTDIQLSQMRKTIARRLGESIGPIPTFYLTAELDMERVAEMRGAMAEMGKEYKVSFNDIVLKAVAVALSRHPEVNAQWLGDRIRQFNRVHIGMAVAIEDGLITPVIFDADRKRLSEISAEARELAGRARDRKLKPEEFTGSTFSVSNLGMFGIDQFTAIINPPEAGILAVGAVEDKPVVHQGEMQVRKRMRVTMSCDHRVIDGALGARFLQTLRQLIENPLMLVY